MSPNLIVFLASVTGLSGLHDYHRERVSSFDTTEVKARCAGLHRAWNLHTLGSVKIYNEPLTWNSE